MFKKKEKLVISVDGMSCEHCKKRVVSSLEGVKEIKKVKVDLNKKEVVIVSDEKIEEKVIKEIIEGLGYVYLGVKEV